MQNKPDKDFELKDKNIGLNTIATINEQQQKTSWLRNFLLGVVN